MRFMSELLVQFFWGEDCWRANGRQNRPRQTRPGRPCLEARSVLRPHGPGMNFGGCRPTRFLGAASYIGLGPDAPRRGAGEDGGRKNLLPPSDAPGMIGFRPITAASKRRPGSLSAGRSPQLHALQSVDEGQSLFRCISAVSVCFSMRYHRKDRSSFRPTPKSPSFCSHDSTHDSFFGRPLPGTSF
jgi:hypothetical protein